MYVCTKLLSYFITTNYPSSYLGSFPKHNLQAFQNEWVEVEVKQPIQYPKSIEFLMDCLTLPKPLTPDSSWEGLKFYMK